MFVCVWETPSAEAWENALKIHLQYPVSLTSASPLAQTTTELLGQISSTHASHCCLMRRHPLRYRLNDEFPLSKTRLLSPFAQLRWSLKQINDCISASYKRIPSVSHYYHIPLARIRLKNQLRPSMQESTSSYRNQITVPSLAKVIVTLVLWHRARDTFTCT